MIKEETFLEWQERITKSGNVVLSGCPGANYAMYLREQGKLEEYEQVCQALCGPPGIPGKLTFDLSIEGDI